MPRSIASNPSATAGLRKGGGNPAWQKGVSGNPRGRPKTEHDVAAMCRNWTPQAVAALGEALSDPRLKVVAAVALLDRAFGRPRQVIETPEGSSPLLLHLAAAHSVSAEILAVLGQRPPPMINGHAEDQTADFNPISAPTPTE